ncbi:MAG: GTPase ObgE [Planctomycetota bacterium]
MAHPFIDETVIQVRSGAGGDGCVSFLREKYVARGGPDGGDGGRGGHVLLRGDENISTLLELGRNHLYSAKRGAHGMGKNRTGANGADVVIRVPKGTLVRDTKTGELIVDIQEHGQEVVIARGGRGGRGNKRFATSTHQAPREFEDGEPSVELELALELKLMADIGLLGLPNAGKSTFLSRVSAARPRIASYPFTTLRPQLGIAELDVERRIVIADIPGLVEGAHQGVGLGIEFLRHLERTRALLHLLDPFERTPEQLADDFAVIRGEIGNYEVDLGQRPIITAINKIDLVPEDERSEYVAAFSKRVGEPVLVLSGVTGEGIPDVLDALWRMCKGD